MSWLVLQAFLGVLMLAAASYGCGAWVANILPVSFPRTERIGISLLAGLGLFSLSLFLIGQIAFTRSTMVTALVVSVLLGIRPIWLGWMTLSPLAGPIRKQFLLPASIVLIVLTVTAVSGTAEIVGDWNQDAVAYHLLGPTVWLREGVIRPVLDNSHTSFPQIPETLFALLLTVGGNRAPDFSSWFTLALLLLISAGWGMRLGLTSDRACWVAAIVATMPAVYAGSHACFVDGLYAAFVLAAARVGFDAKRFKEWALFGVFCGLAMGTKYTGLLALAALAICCVILLTTRNGSSPLIAIKNLSVALAIACAVASPFYIRNWIFLGCPIYPPPPGYALVCSPKYLSQQAIENFHRYIFERGAGLGRGWFAFLKLPFNLTYHTSNFHGAGGIGLSPLGLAPFGFAALRSSTLARFLALLAFLMSCLWFLTQQESRFLIHVYVIAAIFSVAGWNYLAARCGRLQRITATCLIGTSILYGLLMIAGSQSDNLRAVTSSQYARLRKERQIPYLASFEYLNSDPSVKKVLILDSSVPPYYSHKAYIKPVGPWGERTLPGVSTSVEALSLARQLRITHVLDVVSPVSGFQIENPTSALTMVFESVSQRIYRVE